MALHPIEHWLRRLGATTLLPALASIFVGMWHGLRRPRGQSTGQARRVIQPGYYILIGVPYFALCFFLWRPLRVSLSAPARAISLILGALLYFPGLALAVWGRLALGRMYNVSSGFGVQLHAGHSLVTRGPYRIVRHPMYLGILLASLGGLLLYRTWTAVFVLTNFLGLLLRARREEQALASEFGESWRAYCQQVPAWMPKIRYERSA